MSEELDPRIDRMVAFLYGELPPAEEEAFRRLLSKDAALRAELHELSQARSALAGWEVEEHVPSFVLVDGGASEGGRARAAGAGPLAGLRDFLRSLGARPAWALAAAAIALVVLAAAGFRVERVPGGVALRLGPDRPADVGGALPGLGAGEPLELAARPKGSVPRGSAAVPVSGAYLTHDEFESYNADLMTALVGLLNRYDERRDQETAELLQGFYREVAERQVFDYERVNRRIDALGTGLLLESSRSQSIEELLQGGPRPSETSSGAPAAGEE